MSCAIVARSLGGNALKVTSKRRRNAEFSKNAPTQSGPGRGTPVAQERPRYQFGEFELDTPAATLRRGGQEIPLPPRAFQVLAYLIELRRQVVSKQELVEALWKDTFVTDDALVQAVTAVRKALGDDAESPRFIRTKPRVGYQFIAPLESGDAEHPEAAPVSVWEAPLARKRARTLMILIQVGYLGIYAALLLNLSIAADVGLISAGATGSLQLGIPLLSCWRWSAPRFASTLLLPSRSTTRRPAASTAAWPRRSSPWMSSPP
jgi:DNA-binding winged helix-turn-helix (wHTH) protein